MAVCDIEIGRADPDRSAGISACKAASGASRICRSQGSSRSRYTIRLARMVAPIGNSVRYAIRSEACCG
jgi:hypothetical protein